MPEASSLLVMPSFSAETLRQWNSQLRAQSPLEVVRWAVAQAGGRAIVSTNFRPYEAAILHLAVQAQADIPVLWVDHGYNTKATYRCAEKIIQGLQLKVDVFTPRISSARQEAALGGILDGLLHRHDRLAYREADGIIVSSGSDWRLSSSRQRLRHLE